MGPPDSRWIPRVPRYSGFHWASDRFPYRAFTVCGRPFQSVPVTVLLAVSWPYNPNEAGTPLVWALPRSLATTGGIIRLFSLPAGTKMFQFPAFAAHTYVRADSHSDCRVVPFGDPRIKGYLHLIADYRSLSRPSSPVRAKASTVRPKNSLFAFIMIHHTFI